MMTWKKEMKKQLLNGYTILIHDGFEPYEMTIDMLEQEWNSNFIFETANEKSKIIWWNEI